MNRPNVLLISIDTLRADRLGCYGHPGGLTPNLDRIAEEGIRFSQAITGGSWTQAAFPVLLTSTYASMYGGCLGRLSERRPSPVEALEAAGYRTAAFSTSPLLSKQFGYDRGFHDFVVLEPGEAEPWLRSVKGGQALLRWPFVQRVARSLGLETRPGRPYAPANLVTEKFRMWLETSSEPFFAWVHLMDTHWPYHLDSCLEDPTEIAQAWSDLADMYRVNWRNGKLTDNQRRRFIELYEAAVRFVDEQVGAILAATEEVAGEGRTAVFVLSDHGEEFMERRHWGHVEINLHDEIIRVPCLLRLPGGPQGVTIDRQVSLLDIMPTVLDLCQVESIEGLLGASLLPFWQSGSAEYGSKVAICERWREDSHMIAVRTERYKYVWEDRDPANPALYDMLEDPGEVNDLAGERPSVVEQLHTYVMKQLELAESTRTDGPQRLEIDNERVTARLRDLGYLE